MFAPLSTIPRFALPYSAGDAWAGLQAMFRAVPLSDAFSFLGDSPKIWTGSGRQALRLLLNALHLKPGSGVAVPMFTDPSVVGAVAAANHRPVFIDVEAQFLTMDPKSLDAARGTYSAVVPVHLFGQMADMPSIQAIAGDLPVIEDTAHAALSSLNGRMAGSFGLAGFYSFASTKYWPAGGGGLAVVNDPAIAQELAAIIQSFPRVPKSREFRKLILQVFKALVFSRGLYGWIGRPLRGWAEQLALLEPSQDLSAIQRPHAAVANRQAARFLERVERQRVNSLRLLVKIQGMEEAVLPWERPGARYNYHLFPVVLKNQTERNAVRAAMGRRGVDTSKIYFDVEKQVRRYGYRGGCPVAEAVAERLLTLPNYASLSEGDIDRVAETFLDSVRLSREAESRAFSTRLLGPSPRQTA